MKTIWKLAIISLLVAGNLESQEQMPPDVSLLIDGRSVEGSGELRAMPDAAAMKVGPDRNPADLALISESKQRIEIRGSGVFAGAVDGPLRLRYEQRSAEDTHRVFVALLPLSDAEPVHVVFLNQGDRAPIRSEILPGLILTQIDEPGGAPDVNGGAARRTWLTVEVTGAESPMSLEGGETRTISYRGASYRLHVYRSLRRDPGTNPRLPFEGERYLLSAVLTPVQ